MGVQINGDTGNISATKADYSGNVTIGGTLTYEDVTNIDSVGLITARSGIEIGASPGVGASISVDGNAIFSGITTATTLRAPTGIVTSLEASTGNITTLRAPTGIVTSFVTNTAKVGAAVTISESGIEASGIGITCANINGTQIGGRRNIIINGAMLVAQRGTSSTTSGYATVDRFALQYGGTDESPTHAQVDVASGTTPYTNGFRKAHKVTNGNQTSGAGAADFIRYRIRIEAQDIANSGWNYTSSSSYITFSFWIKSSVAQSFKCHFLSLDGTSQGYPFDTGSLTADTSTWWTTNDATLELTGVQLEVGPQATPFEHRSFGEELQLCQRYFYALGTRSDDNNILGQGMYYTDVQIRLPVRSYVEMRAAPTVETTNSTNHFTAYANGSGVNFDTFDSSHQEHKGGIVLGATITDNDHAGKGAYVISNYDASTGIGTVSLNAEL